MRHMFDVILVAILSLYVIYELYLRDDSSQFEMDSQERAADRSLLPVDRHKSDKTINYLRDDFTSYGEFSRLIDSFEDSLTVRVNGKVVVGEAGSESYHGRRSMELKLVPEEHSAGEAAFAIRKSLPTTDLSRWKDSGVVTAWIRLEDPKTVSAIGLRLYDEMNRSLVFGELKNYLGPGKNAIKRDDPHDDYYLPEQNHVNKWEDFMLAKGWNYLFWRVDSADNTGIDAEKIAGYEIVILASSAFSGQSVALDNIKISDGLQRDSNPVNGRWFPPKAMPQFGVFDVDEGSLRLINVRETQYPSNGDHSRILTRGKTPANFAMKVRFKFHNLPKQDPELHTRKNTWFRIAYDFESEYDAGHDWFGFFMSLEYNKYGLVTIIPKERFYRQDEEPWQRDFTRKNRKKCTPQEGQVYEVHLTVRGQDAKATLYRVSNGNRLRRIGTVAYCFQRPRHGIGKCPIAIEATGNTHVVLYSVEILALKEEGRRAA